MDNNFSKHSKKAFMYSLISIIIFVSIVIWLVVSIEHLELGSKIGGGISGILGIFFFVFNYKGIVKAYKGFKNNESFNLVQKLVICGNLLLSIFPLSIILLVLLHLFGVDTFWDIGFNCKVNKRIPLNV